MNQKHSNLSGFGVTFTRVELRVPDDIIVGLGSQCSRCLEVSSKHRGRMNNNTIKLDDYHVIRYLYFQTCGRDPLGATVFLVSLDQNKVYRRLECLHRVRALHAQQHQVR